MRLQGGPLHVGWRCREHLVMYACNPAEGAVDVQRLHARGSPYYLTPTVTCLMGRLQRLPLRGGYLFGAGSNRLIEAFLARTGNLL